MGERGGLKMDEHFELPPGDALDALAAHSLPALVGIGATFKRDKTRGCYVVRRVIERGPADREGGIVPGDVISKVDGILVASKSPEELTKLVLGPSGSSIDLGIMRNGESMSRRSAGPLASWRPTSWSAPGRQEPCTLPRVAKSHFIYRAQGGRWRTVQVSRLGGAKAHLLHGSAAYTVARRTWRRLSGAKKDGAQKQLATAARQEAMPTLARSRSFSLSLSLARSSYISLLLSFSLDRPRPFLLSLAVFSGSLSLSLALAISRSRSLSLSTALALSCYLLLYSL